jgi:hypothetical protein
MLLQGRIDFESLARAPCGAQTGEGEQDETSIRISASLAQSMSVGVADTSHEWIKSSKRLMDVPQGVFDNEGMPLVGSKALIDHLA